MINFGTKMAKTIELYKVHLLPFQLGLIYVDALPRKTDTMQFFHYIVIICISSLTFASSIPQRDPRTIRISWYYIFYSENRRQQNS